MSVVRAQEVEILHLCLDSLAFGTVISIMLGLETERQAFARVLAKITFIERNRGTSTGSVPLPPFAYLRRPDSSKAATLPKRIIAGEHLKQEWYRVRAALAAGVFALFSRSFFAAIQPDVREAAEAGVQGDLAGLQRGQGPRDV